MSALSILILLIFRRCRRNKVNEVLTKALSHCLLLREIVIERGSFEEQNDDIDTARNTALRQVTFVESIFPSRPAPTNLIRKYAVNVEMVETHKSKTRLFRQYLQNSNSYPVGHRRWLRCTLSGAYCFIVIEDYGEVITCDTAGNNYH